MKKEVKSFINKMVSQHHFKRDYLNSLFKTITFQKRALGIFNPKHRVKVVQKSHHPKYNTKHGSWTRYQANFFTKPKIDLGVKYMRRYKNIFTLAYKNYGVPPEYVAAIIGIESRYGVKLGNYPILDTLTTLAFEQNRRSRYFLSELEKFLLLSKSERFNPRKIKGSYAGAIGLGQFMPSAYKAFAVDFNNDGKKDMHSNYDAIASVANYLHINGWKKWEPIAERVSFKGSKRYWAKKTGYNTLYPQSSVKELKPIYGKWSYKGPVRLIKLDRYRYDELWFGAENFYVITRYNHSAYYAMAVHQLAQELKREYKRKHGAILR